MTQPGSFPDRCTCTLERGPCAGNLTDCQLAWVVAYRHSVQPTLADRLFGWLADFMGWRR